MSQYGRNTREEFPLIGATFQRITNWDLSGGKNKQISGPPATPNEVASANAVSVNFLNLSSDYHVKLEELNLAYSKNIHNYKRIIEIGKLTTISESDEKKLRDMDDIEIFHMDEVIKSFQKVVFNVDQTVAIMINAKCKVDDIHDIIMETKNIYEHEIKRLQSQLVRDRVIDIFDENQEERVGNMRKIKFNYLPGLTNAIKNIENIESFKLPKLPKELKEKIDNNTFASEFNKINSLDDIRLNSLQYAIDTRLNEVQKDGFVEKLRVQGDIKEIEKSLKKINNPLLKVIKDMEVWINKNYDKADSKKYTGGIANNDEDDANAVAMRDVKRLQTAMESFNDKVTGELKKETYKIAQSIMKSYGVEVSNSDMVNSVPDKTLLAAVLRDARGLVKLRDNDELENTSILLSGISIKLTDIIDKMLQTDIPASIYAELLSDVKDTYIHYYDNVASDTIDKVFSEKRSVAIDNYLNQIEDKFNDVDPGIGVK